MGGVAVISPRLALRVFQREATLYRRIWPSTILSNLLDPIVVLFALGFGLGSLVPSFDQGHPYVVFLGWGLVASATMMAATYEVAWNSFVRIFMDRSYEGMLTTPATLPDVVAGEVLWATARAVLYATVMLLVLVLLGIPLSPLALLIPPLAILGGLVFSVLGLLYTSCVRHIDQITFYFTLFITPQYFLSGIFFPLDRLPSSIRWVAEIFPLTHLVRIDRSLAEGSLGPHLLGDVGYLFLLFLSLFWIPPKILERRILP